MHNLKIVDAVKRVEYCAVQADEVDGTRSAVLTALADCERALKRIVKRATLPAEFERVEIVQSRGPKLEFTGKLLASEEFTTRGRDPMRIKMELWETQGEALIAASYSEPADREGFEDSRALVVKPNLASFDPEEVDQQAMRFAVMAFFQWDDRARAMVRKLGWDLRQEVD